MKDKVYLEDLNEASVILIDSETLKIGKFRQLFTEVLWSVEIGEFIQNQLKTRGLNICTVEYISRHNYKNKLNKSLDVEILNIGADGWKKGKLSLSFSLEFYTDTPEAEEIQQSNEQKNSPAQSPLDDIREMMNRLPSNQQS